MAAVSQPYAVHPPGSGSDRDDRHAGVHDRAAVDCTVVHGLDQSTHAAADSPAAKGLLDVGQHRERAWCMTGVCACSRRVVVEEDSLPLVAEEALADVAE